MPYKTVQLPEEIHSELGTLKIRLAGSIGSIPTNGEVVAALIVVGIRHFPELANVFGKDAETE